MENRSRTKRILKSIEKVFSRAKHEIVLKKIKQSSNGKAIVDKYNEMASSHVFKEDAIGSDSPIWVCWWQGEAALPALCRACLKTIKAHACAHPVILIDKDNYSDYIKLPAVIKEKFDDGKISITHLSDILRCLLLREHGGIWMDCTIFLIKDIDDFIKPDTPFWSCRHIQVNNNICDGWWSANFWATGKGNILPSFMSDFFLSYWESHETLTEYLLVDYVFTIGRRSVRAISDMVSKVPMSKMGRMKKCMAEPYNENDWEYYTREFNYQKLSYKDIPNTNATSQNMTVYDYFMSLYGPCK